MLLIDVYIKLLPCRQLRNSAILGVIVAEELLPCRQLRKHAYHCNERYACFLLHRQLQKENYGIFFFIY